MIACKWMCTLPILVILIDIQFIHGADIFWHGRVWIHTFVFLHAIRVISRVMVDCWRLGKEVVHGCPVGRAAQTVPVIDLLIHPR
jgi:hypothetical protein